MAQAVSNRMWILHKLLAKQTDEVKVIIFFDNIVVSTYFFDDLTEIIITGSRSSQEIQVFLATLGVSSKPIARARIFAIEQIPPSLDVLFRIYDVIFDIVVLLLLIEAVFEIIIFFVQILLEFLLIRLRITNRFFFFL